MDLMISKKIILIIWCINLVGLFSCTERIHLNVKDSPERLVIYGYITTDTTSHTVRLSRSTGFFATTPPIGVSGAEVSIHTESDTFVLTEKEDEPGVYETSSDVFGEEGMTYTLRVSLDFDGDGIREEFEAVSYLPARIDVDFIELASSLLLDVPFIEIQLHGEIPDGDHFFNIFAYKNSVLLNDSLSLFLIISDESIAKDKLDGLTCFYLNQEEEERQLAPGDTVTLRVDIITEEYADFLQNAQQEIFGSNPIFGGPPANVGTNIIDVKNSNGIPVSGFFSAFSITGASTVY